MAGTVAFVLDDKSVKEDLLSVLTNLSPTETQMISGFGQSTAENVLHYWLKDTLDTPGANAAVEGADAAAASMTNPERLFNFTQIATKSFTVTDTERAASSAAFADRYAYEATKKLKSLKNDMEYAVMRGTIACGNNSVARNLRGVKDFVTLGSSQSGITLSETALNDYLQMVWDQGTEVDEVYGDMYIKRKISNFTANSTKNINSADKRLVNVVDIYESDAAKMVKLFAHRYISIAGTDTNHDVLGIDSSKFKIAYLRKPFSRELARTGDATKGQLVTEFTLECLHEAAGFLAEKVL